jgi:hypothetical protein
MLRQQLQQQLQQLQQLQQQQQQQQQQSSSSVRSKHHQPTHLVPRMFTIHQNDDITITGRTTITTTSAIITATSASSSKSNTTILPTRPNIAGYTRILGLRVPWRRTPSPQRERQQQQRGNQHHQFNKRCWVLFLLLLSAVVQYTNNAYMVSWVTTDEAPLVFHNHAGSISSNHTNHTMYDVDVVAAT